MTKKLNEDLIQNELRSGSVFFRPAPLPREETSISEAQPRPTHDDAPAASMTEATQDAGVEQQHDAVIPRNHGTAIELIRKAVRQFGKEAATYRFTRDEKRALADIVYACRSKDIRTSENELTRIAVNFIIQDYLENKHESILTRVLERLNE